MQSTLFTVVGQGKSQVLLQFNCEFTPAGLEFAQRVGSGVRGIWGPFPNHEPRVIKRATHYVVVEPATPGRISRSVQILGQRLLEEFSLLSMDRRREMFITNDELVEAPAPTNPVTKQKSRTEDAGRLSRKQWVTIG